MHCEPSGSLLCLVEQTELPKSDKCFEETCGVDGAHVCVSSTRAQSRKFVLLGIQKRERDMDTRCEVMG